MKFAKPFKNLQWYVIEIILCVCVEYPSLLNYISYYPPELVIRMWQMTVRTNYRLEGLTGPGLGLGQSMFACSQLQGGIR